MLLGLGSGGFGLGGGECSLTFPGAFLASSTTSTIRLGLMPAPEPEGR